MTIQVKAIESFLKFQAFLKKIDIKISIFIFPTLFGLFGALFEGGSFGLLIPTVKGIIEGNTHFIKDMPWLKLFFSFLPNDFTNRSIKVFAILVLMTFICVVLKNVFMYISSVSSSFLVWRFSNNLRKKIYERYLSFGKLYFDQNNIGRLHELLTGYTKQISLQLKDANTTIFMFLTLLVYLGIMLSISWKLTFFVFLISPVFFLATNGLINKIKLGSDSYIKNYNKLLKNLSNSLLCIPLVKSYAQEDKEISAFSRESDLVEANEFSIDKKRELIAPLNEILVMCLILILVGIMAFLLYVVKEGEIASFMVFFVILRRSIGSFSAVTRFKAIMNSIAGPISEISSIFSDDGKFFVRSGNVEFTALSTDIQIKTLSFSYPGKNGTLKNLSLNIEKNKMTAIVGPSGSGKSTLINILLRFYDFDQGSIILSGESIKDFSIKSYISKIGYISQEVFLQNDTLKNNLLYGLGEKSDQEILNALKSVGLDDLVNKLPEGLNTHIGDRGVKLSGGEKQKLAIGRVILRNSSILIMDEATSSLDSISESQIQNALLNASKDRTSIVIAHRLSTIKHADKIVVLKDGEIKEEGTCEELLAKKGIFSDLWNEQRFF